MAPQQSSEYGPSVDRDVPQFAKLPTELRLRIWQHALANETVGRTIHVAAVPRFVYTNHSCVSTGREFCGQNGECPEFRSSNPKVSRLCVTMRDGYLVKSVEAEHPEEPAQSERFLAISLVCREARGVVTARYPRFLRVRRSHWLAEHHYCFVRCNPALDVLLITDFSHPVRLLGGRDPDQTWSRLQSSPSGDRFFPNDAARFAEFRDMISAFRHVAFSYTGNDAPGRKGEGRNQDQDVKRVCMDMADAAVVLLWSRTPVHQNQDLVSLLTYFTSLEHIYAWPDPFYYPEAQKEPVIVESVEDLKMLPPDHEARRDIDDSKPDEVSVNKGLINPNRSDPHVPNPPTSFTPAFSSNFSSIFSSNLSSNSSPGFSSNLPPNSRPDIQEDSREVPVKKDLPGSPNYIMRQIQEDARTVLRCYRGSSRNQNEHFFDSNRRWVAKSEVFEDVGLGCYVSAAWANK